MPADDPNFSGKARCLNFARSVVFCKEDYQADQNSKLEVWFYYYLGIVS